MTKAAPIAVVGMAGVFPGALELERFWHNIVHKMEAVAEIPDQRWIVDPDLMVRQHIAPDKAISRKACLISDFRFDPDDFEYSSSDLAQLDPLYHLVLHTGHSAVTHPRPIQVNPKRAGVILAAIGLPTEGASRITRRLYKDLFEQSLFGRSAYRPPGSAQARAGRVTSLPATLLAGSLGWEGGGYTLDAACASSIYAVKLACDELQAHRSDTLLAGGVSRPDCLYTQVGFSQLRALSPSGRCAPFDASADGLVVGEGAGMLVLKRLDDALAQGDTIYGVIRGIGLSNDMRGNLLAPDVEGQLRAMQAAYRVADWRPDDVELIECHGAGTPVGDATEIHSLNRLWRDQDRRPATCAIGSVKSGIGHLLTAAGAAGMIKTLLAIHHQTLPPSLNFSRPPEHSPLLDSPFFVPTEARRWQPRGVNRPRRAAVSAFGFGGINAHLLLEEWSPLSERGAGSARSSVPAPVVQVAEPYPPAAVVGLAAVIGSHGTTEGIYRCIADGLPALITRPADRWKGCESVVLPHTRQEGSRGAYIEHIDLDPSDFRIPPVEYADILPQHLLMLKVAGEALKDAGLPLHRERPRTGAIIGTEFDFDATDFHVRWCLHRWLVEWRQEKPLEIAPRQEAGILTRLQDAVGRPLTATGTLGALVSMVASRIAREFRMGGPSFTLSGQAVSGIRALEIGVRMLQRGELDSVLVGAVDLTGDIRGVLTRTAERARTADWPIEPADSAMALVLKPLSEAEASGDRIYAVIDGFGHCSSHDPAKLSKSVQTAFESALGQSRQSATSIGAVELCQGECPPDMPAQQSALKEVFKPYATPVVIGALPPLIGDAGAAAGLAGVVKACLAADRRVWFPATGLDPDGWPPAQFRLPETLSDRTDSTATTTAVCILSEGGAAVVMVAPGSDAPDRTGSPAPDRREAAQPEKGRRIRIPVGRPIVVPAMPWTAPSPSPPGPAPIDHQAAAASPVFDRFERSIRSTAASHRSFLEFSSELSHAYADAFCLQARLLQQPPAPPSADANTGAVTPAFNRQQCLEFATGKAARVLGPEYDALDGYPVRVRLPDEPLMLVDRILAIEGVPKSLSSGRIVTEHDVAPDAWYLDGGHAPTCIAVEAGQADLFLCAYLGIDFKVQGRRAYRLLDASVTFHRHLPRPGETIRYDIRIDKFMRQGDTYLFFFRFEGRIGDTPLISMTDGCAGFFTEQEIQHSGGIITKVDDAASPIDDDPAIEPLVTMERERYDDWAVDALRRGGLAACFGERFAGVDLAAPLRLPGGRMKLIDRVSDIDPKGGRYHRGLVRAEADIHPDDWFLTCHFVDDMTMPGTLMYECCLHALRIFLLRMGWVSTDPQAAYHPLPGVRSVMKCRGPVTPATKNVVYEIELKSFGQRPALHAVADAHMYVDGKYVVRFIDMTLQLTGVSLDTLSAFWRGRPEPSIASAVPSQTAANTAEPPVAPVFSQQQVLAFAEGMPSEAFGPRYRPFDDRRFIARLPRPPYSFIQRVVSAEPQPWTLPADGWVTAEFDIDPEHWYFKADRSATLPYCILMEIALQACGWLAAYAGSALKSEQDMKFRNLDGQAIIHEPVRRRSQKLTTRCRMLKAAMAGDTLIESFEFEVNSGDRPVFSGQTTFGFFTPQALTRQRGLSEKDRPATAAIAADGGPTEPTRLADAAPLSPSDPQTETGPGLAMPAKALRMIDLIEQYCPEGGGHGLGYIRAAKTVDPNEWFFDAHFFQDPVCPGSLGVESLLQLIKYVARQRWPEKIDTHRFMPLTGHTHRWRYRGQIVPANRRVVVEAVITGITDGLQPEITADGWLQVDGLYIYKMERYGFRLQTDDGPASDQKPARQRT